MKNNVMSSLVTWMMNAQLWLRRASPLKADEQVVLFPVASVPVADGKWQVNLRGWVFEREPESLWRKVATFGGSELMELLGSDDTDAHDPRFAKRFSWFLVDNERRKRIVLQVGQRRIASHPSEPNGHFSFPPVIVDGEAGEWVSYGLASAYPAHGAVKGQFQLVPQRGLTVISDIDDTVKISEVLDRQALVRNIFVNDYDITPGMPAFYGELAARGAAFHYLSASPWQLYSELQAFLDEHYPRGSISLRHFRLGDQSFWDFFHSSMDYKLETLRARIRAFPQHRFVLIGDAGEKDPEVYAQIYSEFPQQVTQILIRQVPESDVSPERLQRVLGDVPSHVWQLFEHPQTLSRAFLDTPIHTATQ